MRFSLKAVFASLAPLVMNRALLAALIALPVALIWWSVTNRLPLINKTRVEMKKIYELEAEINRARAVWTDEEARRVKSEWRVVKDNIPAGYEDLAALLESIGARAAAIGLDVDYKVGDLVKPGSDIKGLALAPVTIKLTAAYDMRGVGAVVYFTFLDLLKDLADRRMWVDLTGVSLKGDGAGLREMIVSINVWTGFEDMSTGAETGEKTASAFSAGKLDDMG